MFGLCRAELGISADYRLMDLLETRKQTKAKQGALESEPAGYQGEVGCGA